MTLSGVVVIEKATDKVGGSLLMAFLLINSSPLMIFAENIRYAE
jgi:hypothetical protein